MKWEECSAVERRENVLTGSWVFTGSRVPVAALFENLEDGATVDDFLEWFPGISRKQVEQVLSFASDSLLSSAV